jgi:hypothetical protein
MASLSLTTDSESLVQYVRPEPGDTALLIVDYRVPELSAYRTRDGWTKTIEECADHELEAHLGLLAEVREELLEALRFGEDRDPHEVPLHLHIDMLISKLAQRTCRFVGDRFVEIDPGLFRDEWRVRQLRPETSDAAVVEMMLARMQEGRRQLVREVFAEFAQQAVALDRRN